MLTSIHGGTYVNDFSNTTPTGLTLNGGVRADGVTPYPAIEGGHLAVAYAEESKLGTAILDDLDPGKTIESFNMSFDLRIGGGSSSPADGLAVFFGPIDSAATFGEEGPTGNGLTIAFDVYDNGGGEAPAIEAKVNGTVVARQTYTISGIMSDTFSPVTISLTKNGLLSVTYKGQPVFSNVYLEGYAPASGDQFAIGARTGGSYANHWIDNLNVTTVEATATAPTITTQPVSKTVNERDTVTFTVAVNGSAPFSYQWLSNNVAIDGATSATLTITNAPVSASTAKYKVTVTNASGSQTSGEATLTVTPDSTAPTIATVIGSETLNSVLVTFSEPITSESLGASANYSLSGGLTISAVETVNDRTVKLTTSAQTPSTQYTLTVNGITDTAATANTIAANSTKTFSSFVLSKGFLKFEYFGNIASPATPAVDELKNDPRYPNLPDSVGYITAFNTRTIYPDDSHELYGARISGFIIPSVGGDYRFFIYSDDASELSISTDGNPENMQVIASEPGCCATFTEPGAHTRTSEPIRLEANVAYPIQALLKEGGGGDYLQVAWRNELDAATIPASSLQPIPGSFLATYVDPSAATISFTTQPASKTAAENTTTTFTAAATGSPAPMSYQWQRKAAGATEFTDIAGANSASYTTPILKQTTDNNAVYRVIARVPGASLTSAEATLTVIIDSTAPQLTGVAAGENQKSVTLTFSEALDPTTGAQAANYTINGLAVTAAAVKNGNTVVLTTAPQTSGSAYTVTVAGVKDSAGNLIGTTGNSGQFTALTLQEGVLRYDAYYYIGGTAVNDLLNNARYPNDPNETQLLASFNTMGENYGENFGARMTGFVSPDETGDYRFFIHSDDSSALWISSDDSSANLSAQPIAAETGCCNPFSEPGDHTRTSAPIRLEKGRKYYVLYIFKEGGGGDYGRVAWRSETDSTAAAELRPIPGKNLSAAVPQSLISKYTLANGSAVGSGTTPGFKVRIHQVDQQKNVSLATEIDRAEQQLAGIIGPNVADLTGSTAGVWTIPGYINWNQELGTGGNGAEEGNFRSTSEPSRPDVGIPGIPGTGTAAHGTDSIAGEVIGYVEFPAAGVYYLGVNSDDGFATTATDTAPVNNGALVISGPASVAGSYHTVLPNYQDTAFPVIKTPITGKLVYATPGDGCGPLTNADDVRGNIALIDRGVCTFAEKAQSALYAGAIAVVIVNSRDPDSADGPFPSFMGGGIDFPAVMISKPDGTKIKTAVGQTITVSITPDTTPKLGWYNTGRGAVDSIFPVIVPAAGVYPLRTVWFEGGGGANLELFSVTATGEKVLLNDTENANALKSFTARTTTGTPTISIAQNGANIVITFTGNLYAADKVEGPYTLVSGSGSVTVSATGAAKFYKAGM